jgi:hypothetical protein
MTVSMRKSRYAIWDRIARLAAAFRPTTASQFLANSSAISQADGNNAIIAASSSGANQLPADDQLAQPHLGLLPAAFIQFRGIEIR